MQILRTDRLVFRTWEDADLNLARGLWGDPDVMAFLGGPLSDEEISAKMRAEMVCFSRDGVQYWPMLETCSGDFVGCCGLRPWAYTPQDAHEIGFHIMKTK